MGGQTVFSPCATAPNVVTALSQRSQKRSPTLARGIGSSNFSCQEALHAISDQTDPLPCDAHKAPSLYHICTHYSPSDVKVSSLIPSFLLLKSTFLILMLGPSVTNFLCNALTSRRYCTTSSVPVLRCSVHAQNVKILLLLLPSASPTPPLPSMLQAPT